MFDDPTRKEFENSRSFTKIIHEPLSETTNAMINFWDWWSRNVSPFTDGA